MSGRLPRLVVVLVLLVWGGLWVLRSWACDDAWFTFRVVDHAVRGLGLRWNVADRVQVYTHPLWMLVQLGGAALTRASPERVAYVASLLCTLGAVAVGLATLARTSPVAALGWSLVLLASRSVIDWSASGLENPLLYLLVVLLVHAATGPAERRTLRLATVAGLLALARPDTPLLSAPVVLVAAVAEARTRGARAVLVDLLPGAALVLAWSAFALVYYGSPVPNSALSKLPVGLDLGWRVRSGLGYLAASAAFDPGGAVGLLAAGLTVPWQTGRERALTFGLGLYLLRVVQVGGCYMLGRLVSFEIVVAWLLVAQVLARAWTPTHPKALVALLVPVHLLAFGWGRDFEQHPAPPTSGHAWDLRRLEVRVDAWLRWTPVPDAGPDHLVVPGPAATVHVVGPTGAFARGLRDDAHVVDRYGLGDPLLARRPFTLTPQFPGHYERVVPDGWPEAIAQGDLGRVADPTVRACAERVWRISRGPLWDPARWRAIAEGLTAPGC